MSDDDADISLAPIVDTLRRYRNIIGGAVVAVSVVFVIGVLAMLLIFPAERVASVEFRLLFEGAALGQYPNKMPFSSAEIVSPAVVTEVFQTNELQQYGAYEAFKGALFIQQSNPKLDQLAHEYQGKLADAKLTAVDRSRLEAEFSQKRAALPDPTFSLSLRRSERFKVLPTALAQKVLTDVLAGWAAQAERMGAMKNQSPILPSGALSKERFDDEDYLTSTSLLHARAVRMIETLDDLQKVPGALTIRTAKEGVSLSELRANLEDTLHSELEPLLGIIGSEGVTKNAERLRIDASARAFQVRLERQVAEGRASAVRNALADYMSQRGSRPASDAKSGTARQPGFDAPAAIPQFSESFLDRLGQMSSSAQTSDTEYRQKLTDQVILEELQVVALDKELAIYEELVKSVRGIGSRPAGSPEVVTMVKTRNQAAFASIAKATDQLADLYQQLSVQNLNPGARLFAITIPFIQYTERSLSIRSVALSFVLTLTLTFIAVAAGCLVHDAMKQRRAA
jgi:hypothetical protein